MSFKNATIPGINIFLIFILEAIDSKISKLLNRLSGYFAKTVRIRSVNLETSRLVQPLTLVFATQPSLTSIFAHTQESRYETIILIFFCFDGSNLKDFFIRVLLDRPTTTYCGTTTILPLTSCNCLRTNCVIHMCDAHVRFLSQRLLTTRT